MEGTTSGEVVHIVDETTETVETPAATTGEETQPTETPAEGEEQKEEQPEAPAQKKGIEKRFSELTGRAKAAEAYAAKLEEQNRQIMEMFSKVAGGQPQQEQQQTVPHTRPKPTLESCEYDSDRHVEEVAEWLYEQKEAKRAAEYEAYQRKQQALTAQSTFEGKRVNLLNDGVQKYEDFDETIKGMPGDIMHHGFAAVLLDVGSPVDVAYYLGKNLDEAARISKLPPLQMAYELAKIEAKAVVPVAPKKTSSAPPPRDSCWHVIASGSGA